MANIKTIIQLRNDTSANWETNKTKILKDGEVGIEFQEGGKAKLKIGHGDKSWSDLDYFASSNPSNVYQVELAENESDMDGIERVVGGAELQSGDLAIVKKGISGDKKSYTAYVYNGTAWEATDGNYNANNVYFDKDFTYTANIGTKTVPTSGSGTISAEGKNVQQVLADIFAKEVNPTTTQPSASIAMNAGNGTYEIGTKVNVTYTAALNAGKYQYGPDTGIKAKTYSVSFDGKTAATETGSFADTVAEDTAKKLSVSIAYDASAATPVTNLGNPYASGKIAAGTKTATSSGQVLGVRHMYWGAMSNAATALNSANIRALKNHKATGTGQLASSFIAGAGAAKIVVAVPSNRKITKVLLASSMNADITSQFVEQTDAVAVEGANAYTAANYKIYVYQPASIDSAENYNITIG